VKDIHALPPATGNLDLHRVGVTGIRLPLSIQRPGRVVTMAAEFSVQVNLPGERKGSDLSRNAELLAEVVDDSAKNPAPSMEAVCQRIAQELLQRHPYATTAEVRSSAEYFLSRGIAEPRRTLESYLLLAGAVASRRPGAASPTLERTIGAEAVGMTACPCAMESCRAELLQEFPLLADPTLQALPIVSHNQRNRTRLSFELPPGAEVEADEIIEAIERAQSSPTYAILKRADEARVVLQAHRNPKFVEDVLRDLLAGIVERFPRLPSETVVTAETSSEESIHKYDVTAAHRATLGELRSRRAA
jgi:GTP cyclohydrolase IV